MEAVTATRVKVTSGALVIAFFSVLSRLAGVLRDRALAAHFGAGSVLDAYYAAFKIPDFIFTVFVLGALASAFIPVYIQVRARDGEAQSWRLAQTMFNLLVTALAICAFLGMVFAHQLMPVIAPGFDAARLTLAISLTRVMLLAIVFFGASNLIGSVLQAHQRFVAYSAAPVLYNFGIIGGLYLLVPWLGPGGLAWGVVAGSALHLLIQLPSAVRLGWHWRWSWSLAQKSVREVLKLLGPRTIGLAASSLEQLITAGFLSGLAVGSVAAFTLASNLQSFPINVFGVSLAVAAFPVFSQALSNNDHPYFIGHFKDSVRRILFFVLPLSILFLVLRAQIVRVVLGAGAFDWGDTIRTAQVLGFLSMAMIADSLVPLVARAFYALSDTRTPALVAVGTVLVNVILLISFYHYGLAGIGFAYVVSRAFSLAALVMLFGKRLGDVGAPYIVQGAWRMLVASVAAGAAAYGTLQVVAPLVDMHRFVGIFTQGVTAGAVGGLAYLALAMAWRLPEVEFIMRWLKAAWHVIKRVGGKPAAVSI